MGIWHRRPITLAFSTWLLWPICSITQEQTTSEQSSASTTNKKESKKREKQLVKELGPAYGSWLRDEVPDIITEDERRAFRGLSTNEEREQFILSPNQGPAQRSLYEMRNVTAKRLVVSVLGLDDWMFLT